MGAFTSVTKTHENPAPAGGSGLKMARFTCVGPASYDSGGSVIDLSGTFASKVLEAKARVNNVAYKIEFVGGTSDAATDCKLRVDDNAGAEETGDLSTALAAVVVTAWGTDA